MPRKRKASSKPPRDEQLIPLPEDRRYWYHAALRAAANGLENLFGRWLRRRPQVIVSKKPPRKRRRQAK